MSTWLPRADDAIEIDSKAKEINVLIGSDEWGNTYITLTFEQIKKLYKKVINAGLVRRYKECVWEEDANGNWETDCRNLHILIDGNPIDNGMCFCCYCGGKLSVLVNGA